MSSHSPDWGAGTPQPPPTDSGATQAVPQFVPPSQAGPAGHQPQGSGGGHFSGGSPISPDGPPVGGQPGGGGSQRAILAGVLAGLAVLVLIFGAAYVVMTNDDDDDGGEVAEETTDPTDPDDFSEPTSDPARIGTSVRGIGLHNGDCIDYDLTSGLIETFEIVACDGPHTAEIAGQIEHPDAAQIYPGLDELARFAQGCDVVTDEFLGADVYTTTLASTWLSPDSTDWAAGMYRVLCAVSSFDQEPLNGSAKGNAAAFARSDQVIVARLAAGDCFVPVAEAADLTTLGVDGLVTIVPCSEHHVGYFFGRGVLDQFGQTDSFPGVDETGEAASEACDRSFQQWFTVAAAGFRYNYWAPDEVSWEASDRSVFCAVLDSGGLPDDLAFASYQTLAELPIGSCYLLPPGSALEHLFIDSKVETVDCDTSHNGQLIGGGEFPAGTFPGDQAASTTTDGRCEEHFTDFVGLSSADSIYGSSFRFWSPYEQGWNDFDDRRYACTLYNEDPVVGTTEGAGI